MTKHKLQHELLSLENWVGAFAAGIAVGFVLLLAPVLIWFWFFL